MPSGAAETAPTAAPRRGRPRGAREGRARDGDHAGRAHAGPAAAVRNAEGLVQVQVAHVAAESPGAATPTSAFMLAPSI